MKRHIVRIANSLERIANALDGGETEEPVTVEQMAEALRRMSDKPRPNVKTNPNASPSSPNASPKFRDPYADDSSYETVSVLFRTKLEEIEDVLSNTALPMIKQGVIMDWEEFESLKALLDLIVSYVGEVARRDMMDEDLRGQLTGLAETFVVMMSRAPDKA